MLGSREFLEKVAQLALQLLVISLGAALALPFVLLIVAPFIGG